ncbi:ANTAR domain-containing response regulator [Aquisalimonas asiatica]|uniref:Response regulator receiver and ANTAR domain protein n=1 Tax=Aquisalimonas asiatica TaxID=406100 RepID=A0A1H8PQ17_9GAMM|nr:ANTAR domain-containing protein [Aquisalimonas asiatica]SEO44050.1 response regulator receiver and ANTAR domain protein [Aquisalimonas asiatica]
MATRVMLVDESPDRAVWLGDALNDAGYEVACTVKADEDLYQRVLDIQPDVIIVEARSGRRDILEGLGTRHSPYPKPVVLFTEHSDPELMQAATAAGVSPYVVGGLSAEGVRSIINVAINQFHQYEQLRHELVDARTRLEHQRQMEQAKCFLMERDGISENDAYHMLRRTAMERGRPISDIARAFLRANGRA